MHNSNIVLSMLSGPNIGQNPLFLLKSRCVVPGRLMDAGFDFNFAQWPAACDDLVRRVHAERDRRPTMSMRRHDSPGR
jgi:hypothetical protein